MAMAAASAMRSALHARLACAGARSFVVRLQARPQAVRAFVGFAARRGMATGAATGERPAASMWDYKLFTVRGVTVTPRRVGSTVVFSVIGYSVYQFFTWLTAKFLNLTIFDTGELGFFLGGMTCTAVFVGGYWVVRRYATVQPDAAAGYVMRLLRNDPTMREKFGTPIKVGEFRAYAYKGGLDVKNFSYKPRHLQMLLHVSGPKGDGTASFDISRKVGRTYHFKSLAVDVNGTGERLLYEGENRDVIYNGIIRLQ